MKRTAYSRGMRLWHWLNAVAVLGLLGTVILRKTFLSYKTNGAVIQNELAKLDMEITLDAAKAIAKVIRAPMWEWHYIFGFMLVALFAYRIVLHFKDKSLCFMEEFKSSATLHEKGIYALYGLLYGLIGVMAVTGVVLYFGKDMGMAKDMLHNIKEFHEALMWFFAFFVPAHIIGVFVAENRGEKGLVSDMIGENKQ